MLVLTTALMLIAALAVPALGADGKAKAPVGVWAGPGDTGDDDYLIIAIADGDEGAQAALYVEAVVGYCDFGPGVIYGTVSMNGSLTITGDFVCADTGDLFVGGATLEFDPTGDALAGSSGVLQRACGDGLVTIEGTAGNDNLNGTPGNDIIDGGDGRDTIVGGAGFDILCGDEGNDKLKGGAGIDVMLGGEGNDKLIGGGGWDFGLGGAGKDTIKGGGGNDFAIGEDGDDRILGGGGAADIADGGAGTDECRAETTVACESGGGRMKVTSSAFGRGDPIPAVYTCDGDDISPPLRMVNLPSAAETIAIIMTDPDAPGGVWDHWVVYDIEATSSIPEGSPLGTNGLNSWGNAFYEGPCPPSGTHRYVFDVYALDTTLGLAPGATKQQLLDAMEGHILADASLMGRYSA